MLPLDWPCLWGTSCPFCPTGLGSLTELNLGVRKEHPCLAPGTSHPHYTEEVVVPVMELVPGPHACSAQPSPGLASQHRWTLPSLVLTCTQCLAWAGRHPLLSLLGLRCLGHLLLPACLLPAALHHPGSLALLWSLQGWDSQATDAPTQQGCPGRLHMLPSHSPNPCLRPLLPAAGPLQWAVGQADRYLWPSPPPAVACGMAKGDLPSI